MIDSSFLIMKKHLKSNFKNLLLNFIAMFLSLFALISTLNIISIEESLKTSILNTYPNKNTYYVSKNGTLDLEQGYNIVQKVRPTVNEIESLEYFIQSEIEYDLSYLLDNYSITKNDLLQNMHIVFEPHLLESEKVYYSGINLEDCVIKFSKDFKVSTDDGDVYETFKWDLQNLEHQEIKVFNFLNVPTVYYPYKFLKNAAKSTYFDSISLNLYDYIAQKNNNEIETNYSLILSDKSFKIEEFNKSKYADLYDISNTPLEITTNFMGLFSTILDFSFYFLIAIVVLVIILFLYTIYLIILKNHKEIALLRSYGKSKFSINMMYRIEIILLFIISFATSLGTTFGVFELINNFLIPSLNINFSLVLNLQNTMVLFLISTIVVMILIQIPLIKVNKINIRKELNSI